MSALFRLIRYGLVVGLVNAGAGAGAGAGEPAPPLRLLVLGDSLAAGYGLGPGAGFTDQLQAALRGDGFDVEVLNGGVSGDTTAGGLSRIDWVLADRPDAVIVELGANDGLRGLEPETSRANLDALLFRLGAAGVPVLLTGMKAPPNLGREYGAEFDAVFPELARRHGVAFYPFFLEGVAAVPALNQNDGIHPNAAGVGEIVRRLLPAVRALLERSRVSQPARGH